MVFWYRDFFLGSVRRSYKIFLYIFELLSVPILLKTFFKPLKNEYREGLVLFSIVAGIFIKLLLLATSALFLLITLGILFAVNILILAVPFLIVVFII